MLTISVIKEALIKATWCLYLPTKLGKDFKEDESIERVWVNGHTNTESQRINVYISLNSACPLTQEFHFWEFKEIMMYVCKAIAIRMVFEIAMNQSINKSANCSTTGNRLNYGIFIPEYDPAVRNHADEHVIP